MLFSQKASVYNLWMHEVDFKEGKLQNVSGRPFHSLSLRLGGKVLFEMDGKRYLSEENGITFMPAGVEYVTQLQSKGRMIVVQFETVEDLPDTRPQFLENRADLKPLFEELWDIYSAGEDNHYRCMSLFYTILATLNKPPKPTAPRRIQRAKWRMDKQFSEPLTIAALAKEAGVSDVHFRKEFKHYYGVSPISYLKQVRIENAKQLLRSGYYTVTDVALECGFESISYFSYEFKRLTGVSPTTYLQTISE